MIFRHIKIFFYIFEVSIKQQNIVKTLFTHAKRSVIN